MFRAGIIRAFLRLGRRLGRLAALQDSLCERPDRNHGLELADGVRAGGERLTQTPFKRWPESLYGWLGLMHLHQHNSKPAQTENG